MAPRKNELRRAPRFRHDSVVEIFDENDILVDSGRLVDISDTGASFFSKKTMCKGDKVRVRARILERGVLDIAAQVVWGRDSGVGRLYGLRFEDVKQIRPGQNLGKPY
jgi:hypothetical protein